MLENMPAFWFDSRAQFQFQSPNMPMNQSLRNILKTLCVFLCSVTFTTAALAQISSQTGQITGRVTDKRGDAISNVRVFVVTDNQTRGETKTDASGQYTLSVAPGEYELRASAD